MGKYLLAHDLGTSGKKATLFSTEGQLIASCTYNYDVSYSHSVVKCSLLIKYWTKIPKIPHIAVEDNNIKRPFKWLLMLIFWYNKNNDI